MILACTQFFATLDSTQAATVRTDDDGLLQNTKHVAKQHQFAKTDVNRQAAEDVAQERQIAIMWVHLTSRHR